MERDFGKAAQWFEAAANQGNVEPQAMLGAMYTDSDPPDYEKALYWLGKSSATGNGHALHSLGAMYGNGKGLAQDKKTAMQYFLRAVNAGWWQARLNLRARFEGAVEWH